MTKKPKSNRSDVSTNLSRRRALIAGSLLMLSSPSALAKAIKAAFSTRLVAARTWPSDEYTRLTLELDAPTSVEHFVLDNPHRVVMDIDALTMTNRVRALISELPIQGDHIKSVRIAQNDPAKVRLVIDLKKPVAPQVFTLKPVGDYQYRLVLDLYDQEDRAVALVQNQSRDPIKDVINELSKERSNQAMKSPPVSAPERNETLRSHANVRSKGVLLVAIDAGHGGEDPGAVGPGGTYEKDVVLSIARRLKKIVDQTPGLKGVLIRDGDYFIPLHHRIKKAQRLKADIFLSIHADATTHRRARGGSVYVLSQNGASSAAAKALAQKENNADMIGGVNLSKTDATLAKLLLDLTTDAQVRNSRMLARSILKEMGGVGHLHKRSVEHAGFAVLRSPDIASVLIETAFISTPAEEMLLRNVDFQEKMARSIANGLVNFANQGVLIAKSS